MITEILLFHDNFNCTFVSIAHIQVITWNLSITSISSILAIMELAQKRFEPEKIQPTTKYNVKATSSMQESSVAFTCSVVFRKVQKHLIEFSSIQKSSMACLKFWTLLHARLLVHSHECYWTLLNMTELCWMLLNPFEQSAIEFPCKLLHAIEFSWILSTLIEGYRMLISFVVC